MASGEAFGAVAVAAGASVGGGDDAGPELVVGGDEFGLPFDGERDRRCCCGAGEPDRERERDLNTPHNELAAADTSG